MSICVCSDDSRNFSQGVLEWTYPVTIFSFLDFSSKFFFLAFSFLLESNVMNTILDHVSVCFVKWNIWVPIYFNVPFQSVSGFLKKLKIIYIYIFLYNINY